MNCPKCHAENLADSLFCEECSAPLEAACPSCGAGNRPTAKFCRKCRAEMVEAAPSTSSANSEPQLPSPISYTPKHLAEKILQSKAALEGERKQVTVLFADVKGSMELAEQLDPEQWHGILDRFFAILTDGVHRFEGTVNQYTGDGIMALFGAPIAHEDHAQRACYAALHLRDAVREYADEVRVQHGVPFGVRIGLNSGDVVVGKIGDDLRMDGTRPRRRPRPTDGGPRRIGAHICIAAHRAAGDWLLATARPRSHQNLRPCGTRIRSSEESAPDESNQLLPQSEIVQHQGLPRERQTSRRARPWVPPGPIGPPIIYMGGSRTYSRAGHHGLPTPLRSNSRPPELMPAGNHHAHATPGGSPWCRGTAAG